MRTITELTERINNDLEGSTVVLSEVLVSLIKTHVLKEIFNDNIEKDYEFAKRIADLNLNWDEIAQDKKRVVELYKTELSHEV